MYETLGLTLATANASLFHALLPALEPPAGGTAVGTVILIILGLVFLASALTHLFLAIVGVCGLVQWLRCRWQGRRDEEITKEALYGPARTGIARLRTQ